MGGAAPQCERDPTRTYYLASWGFLRVLGLVYGVAFLSLWSQIDGLIGSRGILPVAPFLEQVAERYGGARYWEWPTLFWFSTSDAALHAACGLGTFSAALLLAGVAELPALAVLWALYLSLLHVGNVFLSFQWDVLLLEVGFLAMFLAHRAPWPRIVRPQHPSPAALWLLRLVLFKLMLLSGWVKLRSGDPTWRDLTAMAYHYQTQPLPALPAYYAHHLPLWFHKLETLGTFAVELLVPWCIFGPRRVRLAAFGGLFGLQVLIAVTGNYTYFNLLTAALCVLLLDDAVLSPAARPALRARLERAPPARSLLTRAGLWRVGGMTAVVLVLSMGGFRTFNQYGLFAVMTTRRPEIIIEGSVDGRTWLPYGFRWKPGDLMRPPGRVAPHQPRLDWQMWFAALGRFERTAWFQQFLTHLLHGTPEVLALLAHNPFPEGPPVYVRAELYEYRFTTREEKAATGAWWARTYVGPYSPVVSREP